MRSLNDKLLYEVMTSFNSDIFVASAEQTFDNTTIANVCSSVNHKIENSHPILLYHDSVPVYYIPQKVTIHRFSVSMGLFPKLLIKQGFQKNGTKKAHVIIG